MALQDTDLLVVNRGGTNYKITASDLGLVTGTIWGAAATNDVSTWTFVGNITSATKDGGSPVYVFSFAPLPKDGVLIMSAQQRAGQGNNNPAVAFAVEQLRIDAGATSARVTYNVFSGASFGDGNRPPSAMIVI